MTFRIEAIDNEFVKLSGLKDPMPIDMFRSNFIVNYCMIVYKTQGGTIDEPYSILDASFMDKKQLYTALSRARAKSQVEVASGSLRKWYGIRREPPLELTNYRFNAPYQNGKIYKMEFSDGYLYIRANV